MTEFSYGDAARQLKLAAQMVAIEFYGHKFEDKPTKLCCRVVDCEVDMSKDDAEKLANELNVMIRPVLKRWEQKAKDRALAILSLPDQPATGGTK